MEFLDDIKDKLGEGNAFFALKFKCYFVGGKMLYIMGIRGVFSLSSEEVVFNLNKKKLKIIGDGLKAEEFSKNDAVVRGNILSIAIEN